MRGLTIFTLMGILNVACSQSNAKIQKEESNKSETGADTKKVVKTNQEWKQQLTALEYQVTREAGTERAFSGQYWNHKEKGTYHCTCCNTPLFSSNTKFKSGTGWPSFYDTYNDKNVDEHVDDSYGMSRTEVTCHVCEAHLGHVFNDGPAPTGLRYCINSVSLKFEKKD